MNKYLFTFPKTTLQSAKDLLELYKPWSEIAKNLNNQIPKETLSNMLKFNETFNTATNISKIAKLSYKELIPPEFLNLNTHFKSAIQNAKPLYESSKIPTFSQNISSVINAEPTIKNFINNVVYKYNHTAENEFEIQFEDVPVVILKPTIKVLIQEYLSLNFDIETAIKIALASYIFMQLFFYLCLLNPYYAAFILKYISDYIYSLGGSILRISIKKTYKFNNPDYLAEFIVDEGGSLLFSFILGLLNK